jgi:tripartite-type tricarboxylate transporter receptor subunit TctC
VQTAMSRQGLEPDPTTPAEMATRIKAETATWAGVVKKAGIRVE